MMDSREQRSGLWSPGPGCLFRYGGWTRRDFTGSADDDIEPLSFIRNEIHLWIKLNVAIQSHMMTPDPRSRVQKWFPRSA